MNIKTMGFAFIVVSVTFGCAGTVDTASQKTVQGSDTVQGTETGQGIDNDAYEPRPVTCKRIQPTGTRTSSRVFATNREWEESAERAREVTEKLQRRPQRGCNTG